MLQIRLFGKPQVICDGTDITPELGNKGCALLCILFLRGGDYYAREKLAALGLLLASRSFRRLKELHL